MTVPADNQLPSLAKMREVLRIGMTRDEVYAACDDLMEHHTVKLGAPTVDRNLLSIYVSEGDALLCFMPEGRLTYAEYKGGVFLE